MSTDEFRDPYTDPETGILRNLVGARTQAQLDQAEWDLCLARSAELIVTPPAVTGTLEDLQAIHRHLFQDLYEWAGQIRTVDIRKMGSAPFMPVSLIHRGAGFCADELRAEHLLRGLPRQRFIERLAHHYDAFNHVHPFREGNGRTQRVFWGQIATEAGWQLDWRAVRGAENDAACRTAAQDRNFDPMHTMLDKITAPASEISRGETAWQQAAIARLGFPSPASSAVTNPPSSSSSEGPAVRGPIGPEHSAGPER